LSRARAEDGFALVGAILIVTVLLALGLGLLVFADVQQRAASSEQSRESAYSLAEAALNAQIFQLSLQWPTPENPVPSSCTEATSTTTNRCPNPASLEASVGYPAAGACTGTEAWGSPLSNRWTTYVRSDSGSEQLFNSSVDQSNPAYDNGDRSVWVRAVGVSRCSPLTIITKVSEQLIPLTFPRNAISANGFKTSNSGNKVIIDTKGSSTQNGAAVSLRCEGLTATECKTYQPGQVSPDTTSAPASPSPTLNAAQLESQKSLAKLNHTYFKAGECPASMSALSGEPIYVEGPCKLSFSGGTANSSAEPGFLILVNGTLELGGNGTFYGVVYALNAQGSSGYKPSVVTVQANAKIVGAVDVDGAGTITFGSSAKNFIYEERAFPPLKTYGGAAPTPNTFRVLPNGQ
jgi:Tfp pilus assembly protein PilX